MPRDFFCCVVGLVISFLMDIFVSKWMRIK